MTKYTVAQFQADFPNDDVCLDYIFKRKYGDNPVCPRCEKRGFYRVKCRKCYACSWCSYQIHPTAGTVFHKSSTRLVLWFYALYLASQSKNGVAAKELERQLGVTYKCAWRIASKIRELMADPNPMFGGTVEVDETYVGGRHRIYGGRSTKKKTPVLGIVERDGKVHAQVIKASTIRNIYPILQEKILPWATVVTDEFAVYKYLNRRLGYEHQKIRHKRHQYVNGTTHTNTIENFWSQLKRSISGTYHVVSAKYLQSYLDEFSFRYNHRSSPLFESLLLRVARRSPYLAEEKS